MKLRTWCIRIGHILTKTVLVCTGFLVFLTLFSPATSQAENGRGGITIRQENAPIEKVFQSIEKQSGYRFFYNETLLLGAGKVTINLQNVSLQEALDACFHNQPLSYAIVDKTIIVKKRPGQQPSNAPFTAAVAVSKPGKIIAVRGKVTSNKVPVAGASVMIKGSDNGASTDKDGMFTLPEVEEDATLVVSSVSHQTTEVRLKGQTFIAIDLDKRTDDLDEAVVVAYNTTTQRKNVGAVTVVKGEEIQNLPNRSFDKSLQGLVPGLLVTSGTGQPGGGLSNFVMRGIATGNDGFSGSTLRNPLIVVDGIPVSQDAQQLRTGNSMGVVISNPMAQLNPSDIESISVLKDAAAIALYGSKASNGVILIVTKKGHAGKAAINYRSQVDIAQRLKGKVELLGPDEYMELLYETYRNTNSTTWTDAAILADLKTKFPTKADGSLYPFTSLDDLVYDKHATTFSNEVSISGGNDRAVYYLNLEYTKQDGIYKKTGYDRKSLRYNFENRVTNWLKVGMSTSLSYNVQDYSYIESNTYQVALLGSPLNPVYLENGQYYLNYINPLPSPNPIAAMEYNSSKNTSYRGLSKVYGELSFLKDFKLTSNVGVDFQLTESKERRDPRLLDPLSYSVGSGRIEEGNFRYGNLITTNTLSYNHSFRVKHSINLLAGQEAQILTQRNIRAVGTAIKFPTNDQIDNTATRTSSGSSYKQTLLSYFGQANYDYQKKYFFSASIRADGSSKFGKNRRFGTYWSTGLGWVASEESFMQGAKKWLDFFKLRGSIGVAGNSSAIDRWTKYDVLLQTTYLNSSNLALYPGSQPANPNVQWEQTFTWDAGLEAKFWKGRINLTADIYKRKTSDLIYQTNLPYTTGYASVVDNIGDIENKGIELSLSADLIKIGGFKWNLNANWSTNKNKLVKANVPLTKVSGDLVANEEGRNFNSFYQPIWAGVDPATGAGQWMDSTGKVNTDYNAAKKQFVGKPQPDGFGAINNTFSFRGVELLLQFYYQYGFQIFNSTLLASDGAAPLANQDKNALDRWQKPGDIAANPKRILNNPVAYKNSTRYISDGDFIRLQNVAITYNLPGNLTHPLHINSLRIYAQAYNLATWTKARVPDIGNVNVLGAMGNDFYPNQRAFSVGLNLNF